MTLNQLTYFCRLAEIQHYGRAAKMLYISQPSLSKSMAQLENELSVTLFDHAGRGVVLTDAGKAFFQQIKPALDQITSAKETMRQYSGSHRLPVIGCVSPAVTSVLSPFLDAYRMEGNSFPKVVVRVDSSEALAEALRSNECDIAFCTRIPEASDLTFVCVATMPFVVVMRDDDPLAAFESIDPGLLRDRPMAFTNANAYNAILNRIFTRYGFKPIIHSYANDDTALFGIVRAGAAIFITSDYPQIYSRGLTIRPLEQDVCQREICLAYTARSLMDPAVASMIDFLQSHI